MPLVQQRASQSDKWFATVNQLRNGGFAAQIEVRALLPWMPIEINASILERAWHIESRFQLSW